MNKTLSHRKVCRIFFSFFLLGALISPLLLSSCVSAPSLKNTIIPVESATEEKLDEFLESAQYGKLLQLVQAMRNSGSLLSENILQEKESIAFRGLQNEFDRLMDEGQYLSALQQYRSLVNVGIEEFDKEIVNDLTLKVAEQFRDGNNKVLASVYLLQMLENGNVSEAILMDYLQFARSSNNRYLEEQIKKKFRSQGITYDSSFDEPFEEIAADKMMLGTVTIWVNKGIKIEGGIGMPDRVIGSGFFIDQRGYILTNYHVIESEVNPEYEGYSRLYIRVSNDVEEKIPAKVVGYDKIFDVALLKTEVEPQFTFTIASIADFQLGETIYAIGSPAGLENTITSGIISAKERRFLQLGDALQVDVPINPGNSGGPLINSEGYLVGIVFAGIEQFEGINFAIPLHWIQQFFHKLYDEGAVKHPWAGLALYENDKKLEVQYTVFNSPANQAGILPGDIIETINGITISTIKEAQEILLSLDVGSLITLDVIRAGAKLKNIILLDPRPQNPLKEIALLGSKQDLLAPLFGFSVNQLGTSPWSEDYTVTRVYKGSIADETGISINDPISIQGWIVDEKANAVLLRIFVKKRKAGFLETGVQLGAYLELDNLI